MSSRWGEIQNLRGKTARDKLANLTREEALKLAKRHSKQGAGKVVDLEGGGDSPGSGDEPLITPPQRQPTRPISLGEAIKERRLARERANRGTET